MCIFGDNDCWFDLCCLWLEYVGGIVNCCKCCTNYDEY